MLAANEGDTCGSIYGGKTSAAGIQLAVESHGDVFLRSQLDDSSQLSAVLRRIVGSDNAKRFDFVGVEGGRESRRAILRQRETVDDILHVVFRAARVQHAIGFEQPSWLIGDQVKQIAARLRTGLLADGLA